MSVRFTHSIEIARPARRCWAHFADLSTWPRWFPMLERVERGRTPATAFDLGETLTLHLGFRGRGVAVTVKIEELAPERTVRWIGRNLGVTGDHAFRLEPIAPDRVRFTSDERFSGLPVRLVPRSVFREIEGETVAGLERFRALVEQD